jgi:hypothetical protein
MVYGGAWGRLWTRVRGGSPSTPEAPAPEATEPHDVLAQLTTPQLCGLWRKSLAGLRSAVTPAERLEVVEAREVLLSELARRDPQSMSAWVASGGAEADGPPAYLLGAAWLSGDR